MTIYNLQINVFKTIRKAHQEMVIEELFFSSWVGKCARDFLNGSKRSKRMREMYYLRDNNNLSFLFIENESLVQKTITIAVWYAYLKF